MAFNGEFGRRKWSDEVVDLGLSPSDHRDEVHVLAVDDSLVDRKVIERLLKISSCKVTAVDSGRRALQFLGLDEVEVEDEEEEQEQRSNGFDGGLKVDLVITDYCMPGMTGYELLKKIKESSTFRETPVVIMSSENVLTRINRCLEEGAEDFIVKPVKLSDVKRLKDHMLAEDRVRTDLLGINKRKSREPSDLLLSSPSPSPQFVSPFSPSSPSSPHQLFSSDSSSDTSEPSSPNSLHSPTRRLKLMSKTDLP